MKLTNSREDLKNSQINYKDHQINFIPAAKEDRIQWNRILKAQTEQTDKTKFYTENTTF